MAKKKAAQWAVITSRTRDIAFGRIVRYDPVTAVAEVAECSKVWRYTLAAKVGGIDTLAAQGPDPRAENRIGAKVGTDETPVILSNVAEVWPVTSAEARAAFEALR
jgi:hypothetical protein